MAKTISMGSMPGDHAGRCRRLFRGPSIAAWISGLLWGPSGPVTTTSPGPRRGARPFPAWAPKQTLSIGPSKRRVAVRRVGSARSGPWRSGIRRCPRRHRPRRRAMSVFPKVRPTKARLAAGRPDWLARHAPLAAARSGRSGPAAWIVSEGEPLPGRGAQHVTPTRRATIPARLDNPDFLQRQIGFAFDPVQRPFPERRRARIAIAAAQGVAIRPTLTRSAGPRHALSVLQEATTRP